MLTFNVNEPIVYNLDFFYKIQFIKIIIIFYIFLLGGQYLSCARGQYLVRTRARAQLRGNIAPP